MILWEGVKIQQSIKLKTFYTVRISTINLAYQLIIWISETQKCPQMRKLRCVVYDFCARNTELNYMALLQYYTTAEKNS